MAAFKEQIDRDAIVRLTTALTGVWKAFPHDAFVLAATTGLGPLELKARVAHVAAALAVHLPTNFAEAARYVGDAIVAGAPWKSFDLWPMQHWAMVAGIDHPAHALPLIARVTPFFTGEFALRPFIDRDPVALHATLLQWARDPNEHVRRLASEGSRPRLPWGPKLTVDARWAMAVLDTLFADPSEYVRRSVANHLNDIAHVDPEFAVAVAYRWASLPGPHNLRTAQHAMRTLTKRGHPAAIALMGGNHEAEVVVKSLTVSPASLRIGAVATLALTVVSAEDVALKVVVDYRVDYVGAKGSNPRTFKWCTLDLAPRGTATLQKRQHFRDVSIRTHRPGPHTVTVLVNGKAAASVVVTLTAPGG